MGRFRAALRAALSGRRRRGTPDAPDSPSAPGDLKIELTSVPDASLDALAAGLMAASVVAEDQIAARLLHAAAREAADIAMGRAEAKVVRTAENLLQIRVWRAPEDGGDVGGG